MQVCILCCVIFSDKKRERGNYLYAHNDFARAITVYEK